jgi:hypothetical protein
LLLERASLRRRLAEEAGRPVGKLFGSLKAEDGFDSQQSGRLRISLDSS